MTAPSSEQRRGASWIHWLRPPARVADERGSILVMTGIALAALLGAAGLALDFGRIYIEHARLSGAADAVALAAARALREGETAAREQALAIASANGLTNGEDGVSIGLTFGTNPEGEQTVRVDVSSTSTALYLLRPLVSENSFTVRRSAVAAVQPIDLVLVLDQSTSLSMANAWDDVQRSSKEFVRLFDDRTDQVGLVSYFLRGVERRKLQHQFTMRVTQAIDQLGTVEGTNMGEGLRLARVQMESPQARDRSVKVVVLFTDGRPNAFRGNIGWNDRILMADSDNAHKGYFNNPDALPHDWVPDPDGCVGKYECHSYSPRKTDEEAARSAIKRAEQLRAKGIYVYGIGLGSLSHPWLKPDLDLLRALANEDGRVNRKQPQGKVFFAPSPADLQAVFHQVARDVQTRLVQ